jgi:hypothetical protein
MQNKAAAVSVTAIVWGLAGGLFGAIFNGLYQILLALGLSGWQPLVGGAAIAAMATSAFYGSMPVAMVGAMAGMLGAIGYLMIAGQPVALAVIALTCGLTGLVVGQFHAWLLPSTTRPLGVILTGLAAGAGAGTMLAVALALLGQPVSPLVIAAGVVALVGILFEVTRPQILRGCFNWLPPGVGTPVVAAVVATVVGCTVGIMSGIDAGGLDRAVAQGLREAMAALPSGFIGGMIGGAVTGAILEAVGVPVEDEIEHNM